MSNPFETQIKILEAINFTEGDKTISNDAAIRVLEAAGKVDKRDMGRAFTGFVSTELRDLLEAIREAGGDA